VNCSAENCTDLWSFYMSILTTFDVHDTTLSAVALSYSYVTYFWIPAEIAKGDASFLIQCSKLLLLLLALMQLYGRVGNYLIIFVNYCNDRNDVVCRCH